MSKNIILGGTEFVTGDEWSKYVLKMHNITCRCDDHIRCMKIIVNDLVEKQGNMFNIYQTKLSKAITYTSVPAHDTVALIEKIRELKGTEPDKVDCPATCTEPIKLLEYLNYINDLHNEIMKRAEAIIADPEKWRNNNAIIDNIFSFAAPPSVEPPAPVEPPAAPVTEVRPKCINCVPNSGKTQISRTDGTLFQSLENVPAVLLDLKVIKEYQASSGLTSAIYRNGEITTNTTKYANVIIGPQNSTELITLYHLQDNRYFAEISGIWLASAFNNIVVLIKSVSGKSYDTVNMSKNISTWLENNTIGGQIGRYNLKKYLELLEREGFIIHHSDFKANEEIILDLNCRYTENELNKQFDVYLNYSEYDIINMDWSEYDEKIAPLTKEQYEYAYSANITNNKICISYIFKEHGSATEVVSPNILDYMIGHTHPDYRYKSIDIEPPSIDDIEWFISQENRVYNNHCVINIVSAPEGAYIITVSRHAAPVLDQDSYFKQFNKISGRYTFSGAISKLKRIYANFNIILYFRPTPGFDMNKTTYPNASFLKLTDSDNDALTKNFDNIQKTDFAKMDLSDFEVTQNVSDYSFTIYPAKLVKNKLSPGAFTQYTFTEDFNSITADIMPLRLPLRISCIVLYFKELPSIISFDSIKLLNDTYLAIAEVKYYVLMSKKRLSVVYKNNDTFELYGPINK